jgi:hypothetical protein
VDDGEVNEKNVDDVNDVEASVNDVKDIEVYMDNEHKADDKVLGGSTGSKVVMNKEDDDNYKDLVYEDGLDNYMDLDHDEYNHSFDLHRQNEAFDCCSHVEHQEGKCIKDLEVQIVLYIKNIQALEVGGPLD